MKSEFKKSWVATLRSGNYRQGRSYLRDEDNSCCCLGVLCDITRPTLWRQFDGTRVWTIESHSDFPSPGLLREWGLSVDQAHHLANMNDTGKSFAEIADFIEKHY